MSNIWEFIWSFKIVKCSSAPSSNILLWHKLGISFTSEFNLTFFIATSKRNFTEGKINVTTIIAYKWAKRGANISLHFATINNTKRGPKLSDANLMWPLKMFPGENVFGAWKRRCEIGKFARIGIVLAEHNTIHLKTPTENMINCFTRLLSWVWRSFRAWSRKEKRPKQFKTEDSS